MMQVTKVQPLSEAFPQDTPSNSYSCISATFRRVFGYKLNSRIGLAVYFADCFAEARAIA